jgi:hypothetical protein
MVNFWEKIKKFNWADRRIILIVGIVILVS